MSLKIAQKGKWNKIRKEKPEVSSLTWVMVFLVAENENRQLEDLPQADFGRVHENISFVGKEKVNNWEFWEKKATPIVCFCNGSTHFFHLESYRQCALRLLFGGLWNLKYRFLKSQLFFPVKAYCDYMINKIIDGRLQIWNFSSRVYLDTKRL